MTSQPADGEWVEGPSILAPDALDRLEATLEITPIIVEHRFLTGARSPHRFVADDFAELRSYLTDQVQAGDAIWIWRFDELCRDDNPVVRGRVPNAAGRVPRGGAYCFC